MSSWHRWEIYVEVVIRDAVYGDVFPVYLLIITAWSTSFTFKMINLWAPRKQISWPGQHYFALGVLRLLFPAVKCLLCNAIAYSHCTGTADVVCVSKTQTFQWMRCQTSKYEDNSGCVDDFCDWGNGNVTLGPITCRVGRERSRGITVLIGVTLRGGVKGCKFP